MLRVEFPAWTAAFSERSDGDLRVSARTAVEPLAVVQERVRRQLGVDAVVVARQVHGADVVRIAGPLRGYAVGVAEGDAVATAQGDIATAVHVADCLPVGVGGEGAVAMAHAGWRGLEAGVLAATVAALRELGAAGDLQAVIGPGVGGCCYETGDEVRERFAAYAASRGRLLDLKAVARTQLQAAGVAVVEDLGLCTMCTPPERLFSHRRDGAATGRHGGFAWLR